MATLIELDWILAALMAPFVGSFLGLVVARLPAGGRVVLARSACPACDHRLGLADLVPILSWLISRGRCRYCGAGLSTFYPGVELAALLVAVWAASVVSGWVLWASCGLGWTLLTLALIDWRHHLLPDQLTLPLAAAGLVVAYAVRPEGLVDHMAGAAAGFAGFVLVAWLYRRLRAREGLGLGDAKLLAAAGAWVSWVGLPGVVLTAALAALAVALAGTLAGRGLRADTRLPFGPYLALGTWLVWLYGPLTIAW